MRYTSENFESSFLDFTKVVVTWLPCPIFDAVYISKLIVTEILR